MPSRRKGSYGRRAGMSPIHSMKNVVAVAGAVDGTSQNEILAKAVDNPDPGTNASDCSQGSTIKAIHISMDFYGTAGSQVSNNIQVYLIKNPGANLTVPNAGSTGTSNEKRFVIKEWGAMIMRNGDGNPPVHWEQWIKIPRRFWRMGMDDIWQLVFKGTSSVTGLYLIRAIYKYYS